PVRARGQGADPYREALRRTAAAARLGPRVDRPAGSHLSGRADDRSGSPGPARPVGCDPRPEAGGTGERDPPPLHGRRGAAARPRTAKRSRGQRQRLVVAFALIGRPEVIFLGEPSTGLDPQARRDLWDVIRGLKREGRAIVISTHYMGEVEHLCDRVLVMDRGRILASGTLRELMNEYGPESVVEIELDQRHVDTDALSGLDAVIGVKVDDERILLYTAHTARTLMDLPAYAQRMNLPLGDLRTRSASMDDVFIALTGRSVRA